MSVDTIRRSFGHSTERVFVVNYECLAKVLEQLEGAIMKDIETEKVYGKLIGSKEKCVVTDLEGSVIESKKWE